MGNPQGEVELSEAELAATREPLPPKLEAILDSFPVRPVLEYVGRRLALDEGTASLDVVFTDGHVRKAWLKRGPVSVLALEELARPPAPPLGRG